MKQEKQIFVVSDLHMGSGGRRDNFSFNHKECAFFNFLDHVEKEDGELIITGDLIDLWRFGLNGIVKGHKELFDRLSEMDCTYILGNHDQLIEILAEPGESIHPFFANVREPFVRTIASERFHFMHGHEIDPVHSRLRIEMGRILGLSAGAIEWLKGAPVVTSDKFETTVSNFERKLLLIWKWVMDHFVRAFGYECGRGIDFLMENSRLGKMLSRHDEFRICQGHDISISAHTHKAGSFKDWYFNSGSWVGYKSNFLKISPSGSTAIFDWTRFGPQENRTILCAQ